MSSNNEELEKLEIGLKYLHNFECFLDEMQKLITDYNIIIHHSDDYKQGDIEDLKKLMRSSWEIIDDKDALTSLKQKVWELSYN